MDNDHSTKDEANPVKREDDQRPVAWTPEDASRFLTSAIHEAQKPLADALKSRPITTSTLVLVLLLIFAGAAGTGWILFRQLEKTERIADSARSGLDDALSQQHQLQARSDTLQARLDTAQAEQERLTMQYREESESLRTQMADKRDNEEELRKTQSDLQRFRRQNELLKSQISGLEMEKQALARQLEAIRAMADDGFDIPGIPAGPAEPESEPPVDTPPLSSSSPAPEPEPPLVEAPVVIHTPVPTAESDPEPPSAPSAPEAEPETPAAPAEPASLPEPEAEEEAQQQDIAITADAAPAAETIAFDPIPGAESETGTLTAGENGENPPTLYETSRLNESATARIANAPDGQITITGAVPTPTPEQSAEESAEPEPTATGTEDDSSSAEPDADADDPSHASMDSTAIEYSKQIDADQLPVEPTAEAEQANDSQPEEQPTQPEESGMETI